MRSTREKYPVFAYTLRIVSPTSKKVPAFSSFENARAGYCPASTSADCAFASTSSDNKPVAPT